MASRTRRPRRDTADPIVTTLGGLGVVATLIGFLLLAGTLYSGVPGRSYATVYVSVPRVGNLLTHDQVRVGGVRVGQVMGRDVGSDGQPRIKLQLEPGTTLTADTAVAIRANGLLGARYVQLIPGKSSRELAEGATIRGGEDSFAFGLPEALDTFDKETRGGLRDTVGSLGQGLMGHGTAVNDILYQGARQTQPVGDIARAILARPGAAGRLLPSLAFAATPLDKNRIALSIDSGLAADALEPFVRERDAVRSTLTAAPAALRDTALAFPDGNRLLSTVRGLSRALGGTLPAAPAGLRSLSGLLRDAPASLRKTTPLLNAVPSAVPATLRITTALKPVLKPADKLLADGSPVLSHLGRYECDIVNFGTVMRSMTGFSQPGPDGPTGPPQAFRLQVVSPTDLNVLGVADKSHKRDAVSPPCQYPPSPYAQFVPGTDATK
jgi:ABC-type transporter Mla subunit MlaD